MFLKSLFYFSTIFVSSQLFAIKPWDQKKYHFNLEVDSIDAGERFFTINGFASDFAVEKRKFLSKGDYRDFGGKIETEDYLQPWKRTKETFRDSNASIQFSVPEKKGDNLNSIDLSMCFQMASNALAFSEKVFLQLSVMGQVQSPENEETLSLHAILKKNHGEMKCKMIKKKAMLRKAKKSKSQKRRVSKADLAK